MGRKQVGSFVYLFIDKLETKKVVFLALSITSFFWKFLPKHICDHHSPVQNCFSCIKLFFSCLYGWLLFHLFSFFLNCCFKMCFCKVSLSPVKKTVIITIIIIIINIIIIIIIITD